MNINYILKVEDAKLTDIQKALTQAGIKVRSIIEVFKEGQAGATVTSATNTSPTQKTETIEEKK
jgi:hypothetical protein